MTFTVTVTNTSGQPVTLSNFPPILSVMQASSGRAVYTFPLGQTQVTLAPDQQKQFAETWSQTNTTGGAAPAGSYYIELEDLQLQGQPVKLMLTQPARFDIISADSTAGGGVLKTITVNKSQAAGGAMVTLQRVDLTSTGFRVYAFAVRLPGYSPTDPPGKYQVSGTYYVDNGWGNDAGMCGALVKADGVYLTWQIKSGLPQDAAKLTFAFRLGGADWLFDVPLR